RGSPRLCWPERCGWRENLATARTGPQTIPYLTTSKSDQTGWADQCRSAGVPIKTMSDCGCRLLAGGSDAAEMLYCGSLSSITSVGVGSKSLLMANLSALSGPAAAGDQPPRAATTAIRPTTVPQHNRNDTITVAAAFQGEVACAWASPLIEQTKYITR